jgi:hypothetical protein
MVGVFFVVQIVRAAMPKKEVASRAHPCYPFTASPTAVVTPLSSPAGNKNLLKRGALVFVQLRNVSFNVEPHIPYRRLSPALDSTPSSA